MFTMLSLFGSKKTQQKDNHNFACAKALAKIILGYFEQSFSLLGGITLIS